VVKHGRPFARPGLSKLRTPRLHSAPGLSAHLASSARASGNRSSFRSSCRRIHSHPRIPPPPCAFMPSAFKAAAAAGNLPVPQMSLPMRAQLENRRLVSSHWGVYEALAEHPGADAHTLRALPEDPDPSPIGLAMLDALRSRIRVQRPSIRKGWLDAFRRGEV